MTLVRGIVNVAILLFVFVVLYFVFGTVVFARSGAGTEATLLASVAGTAAVCAALLVASGWHGAAGRRGYVLVTLAFVAFWIYVFWPTIVLWWANR
jgi:hypothetical protein